MISLPDWFILVESRETGSGASDIHFFFKKRKKNIFSLSTIQRACGSQTTHQTQNAHLHMFILVSLCCLAMKSRGVRWLPKIQQKRTISITAARLCTHKCGLNRFPELFAINRLLTTCWPPSSHWYEHQNLEPHCKASYALDWWSNCLCKTSSRGQLEIRISLFTLNMQIQFVIPSALTLGEHNKERRK